MKPLNQVLCVVLVSSILSGCAAAVIGGAIAVGADSLLNRRSTGAQADDEVMELRVKNNAMSLIKRQNPDTQASISVVSYDRRILLVGQVQNEIERQLAEQAARSEKNMQAIYNYIQIFPTKRTLSAVNNDTWITTKVRSRLLGISGMYSGQVKVVTFNRVVYLMGLLTPAQQTAVIARVSTTPDVLQVVTLFENYPNTITPANMIQ